MSRERRAKVITSAFVVVAAAFLVIQKHGKDRLETSRPKDTPEDTIYSMLDAARAGDVAAFLAQYTGEMATSLQQTIREKGESGLRDYLRNSNSAIKGVALNEAKPLSDREVEVRVEYVYQDRNEVQMMRLEKTGGAWKIARVESAERVKTLIPYGTPVQ